MKNPLENLELKLLQTRRENAEKLDEIETEFKKEFGDFFDNILLNDNLGFKRFVSVNFQLEKLDNPEKNNLDILKNSFKKALEILPLDFKKKQIFETKFFILLTKNISFEKIFLNSSDLRKNHNFPILESLLEFQILNKNDLIKISLKFKETNNFLSSISSLHKSKQEIIKNHYYELNDLGDEKRRQNFEHDFEPEIQNSKLLKIYPKVLKFVGRNYFRLKLKNKIETKKQKLKRLYKIAFLKLYRLKYSGIDIEKILAKIETFSDFDEFISLIIKYFEVLKQNPNLQQDYIVSDEIDELNSTEIEAEKNKDKILFAEKNTIKVNEVFEKTDKKFTQSELDELLGNDVDLLGNEFLNRNPLAPLSGGIYEEENLKNSKLEEDESEEEIDEEVDLQDYYEELKQEYEKLEKKKLKIFLEGNYDLLDEINDDLLGLLAKIEKLEKLLNINLGK